jgi:hypothetical protein
VRSDLASGGSRQLSETADRLSGQFYFRPPEPKAEAPGRPAPQQPSLADLPDYVVWKGIENSVQPADYEFFLKTHPQSQLRGLAEDRLRRLMAGLGMSVEVVPAKPSAPPPPEPLTVPEGRSRRGRRPRGWPVMRLPSPRRRRRTPRRP